MSKYSVVSIAIIVGIVVTAYLLVNSPQSEVSDKAGIMLETGKLAHKKVASREKVTFIKPANSELKLDTDMPELKQPETYESNPELRRLVELEQANLSSYDTLMQLTQLLKHDEELVRSATIEYISELKHPGAFSLLIDALSDNVPKVRIMALEALAQHRDDILAIYIEPMLFDNNKEVRIAAIKAIGEFESEQSVYAISGLLMDSDNDVRLNAVNAMGEIGGDQAGSYLSQLVNDPNILIRENVHAILAESNQQEF
ncbi:MAG: hypothetical protein B6D77_07410 [gamma proteobacterium symbiont of Ctena orbiculata]|nr:MAG: hypothetical protein B6D77_07410 [gamma proteobacterium symbiont of Ctena orbiculata]PVV18684.1 MAG: hypothetical protein B6D78_15605 [gamma proteobacterium symbiont of Ctena orbiculata]